MNREQAIKSAKEQGLSLIASIRMANGYAYLPIRNRIEGINWFNFNIGWFYEGSQKIEDLNNV